MLFSIESDSGDKVVGYLVPDGFTGQPSLRVCSQGEVLLEVPATEPREGLVAAGRHATGLCGFAIDTTLVPGLGRIDDLELIERDSNTLVYRRRRPQFVARKVLRVETHLLPLARLDQALWDTFQHCAMMIDQHGRETVTQLFVLHQVDSVYLSGRLLYRNYAYFAEAAFQTALIMHDPYVELAERLLLLRRIGNDNAAALGLRDALTLRPAIGFATQLPLDDAKALNRALRDMPGDAAAVLTNPLVRQLTTAQPDEMPGAGSVAAALDVLASFAVVGLRRQPETFLQAFAELTGVAGEALPPIRTLRSVEELAETLRHARAVAPLIDRDLDLYRYVSAAFDDVG